MEKINVGDKVYTYFRQDRYPINQRSIEKIITTKKGTTIIVKRAFDDYYEEEEETIEMDISEVYTNVNEFKKHLEKCRNMDIQKINETYDEFLNNYYLK